MCQRKVSEQSDFVFHATANRRQGWWAASWLVALLVSTLGATESRAAQLQAGAAKIDISRVESGPLESPLFAKALVIIWNTCDDLRNTMHLIIL